MSLLFIALSGFFCGLFGWSQVSEWRTAVYSAFVQQRRDLSKGPSAQLLNQMSYSKILAASSWVKNNSISVLLYKVSREHADVSVIHVYTKVHKWCMKPRLHFIYQVRRSLAMWGFGGFLSWYWLDTKVRRNTKEIQLASLVNHAWCCDQARWQNLNFPKQVWKLWQMRRQIIVTILGAEEIDFIIGLSLKIPLLVTAWWVSRVIIPATFPFVCKV